MRIRALQFSILSILVFRSVAVVVDVVCSAETTLYRNGVMVKKVERGFHSLHVELTKGDVLALAMTPPSTTTATLTVKADTQPRLTWRQSRTASDGWQDKGWMGGCSWDKSQVSDATMAYRGAGGGVALFRGVMGDPCIGGTSQKTRTLRLTAAANDQAWVFLNGAHLGDVQSVTHVWSRTLTVRDGDVVTLKAMARSAGGIIASANVDGKDYTTGTASWRVGVANGDIATKSMVAGFDDCKWTPGVPAASTVTRAPTFPYKTGAEYVWPGDANIGAVVIARFVVGGAKRCGNGQMKTTANKNMCSCEMIPTNAWAKCYYFTDNYRYACKMRRCEPKYVCTSRNTGTICMGKQIKERVIPIEGRVGVCKATPDNSFMYMPYGQQG